MGRPLLEVSHYENKLFEQYGSEYRIIPVEGWKGVKTDVEIYCVKCGTKRQINLQMLFKGKHSTHPCHACAVARNR